MSHTGDKCPFCAGSGVVVTLAVAYDHTMQINRAMGERTRPCPMGCNPDNVSRILANSRAAMDAASLAVGMTPVRRDDDDSPDEPPSAA